MTSARRYPAILAAGLLAATLTACGGSDDLTEAEACGQYNDKYAEVEERAADINEQDDLQPLFVEFEEAMTDLSERSPDNLAPLFEQEAELMRALIDGSADLMLLESSQTNTAAIEAICGTHSSAG